MTRARSTFVPDKTAAPDPELEAAINPLADLDLHTTSPDAAWGTAGGAATATPTPDAAASGDAAGAGSGDEATTGDGALPRTADVVVVGAGFGGVDAAIQLIGEGIDDVLVLERADDVAGCWRANHYPGVACDVPSNLYSYSYAPNPDWSRTYSPGGEIADYVRRVARDYGVMQHIRFGVSVTGAQWSQAEARWIVETDAGIVKARFLIGATGPLTEPAYPNIPGRASFAGAQLHSARWDHSVDMQGKRIAVIGTGASAIQFVPELQKVAGQLDVYQRTAPWVLPRTDRPTHRIERALFRRFPKLQQASRAYVYASREAIVAGMRGSKVMQGVLERIGTAHLQRQVRDPQLRSKLEAKFDIGCKRILLSNTWYPALASSNVELITDGAEQIDATGITTADGTHREYDVIVYGTGFHVTDAPTAGVLRNDAGVSVAEHWQGSPKAYLGTTIDTFPNLFMLVGPNSGVGHTSILLMIEWQNRYAAQAIKAAMATGVSSYSLRPDAMQRWTQEIDEQSKNTVWVTGGCASYYLDETGRNATVWPTYTWKLKHRLERFDPALYEVKRTAPVAV